MGQATLLMAQDSGTLFKKATQLFLESVAAAVKERQQVAVAFSGGSTPKKFFELLAEPYQTNRIEWSKVHIFWVDERCVPPQHADSNFGMTHLSLLAKVPLPASNIHRMAGEMSSPHAAAKAYENELRSFFKLTKSPPRFDFILLGMGDDGHTASLFPNSDALIEKEHWVTTTYVEKFSSHRVTLTFPILNNARRVLFLVSGPSKSAMLKQVLSTEDKQNRYPAQMISLESGEVIWLFDKEAASKLSNDIRYSALHI